MIEIKTKGVYYGRWKTASIELGCDRLASSFSLSVSDSYNETGSAPPIKAGDAVEIYIDENLVLTGYADEVTRTRSASMTSVSINGRSKSGDLIDCSAAMGEYPGYDLGQILKTICGQYGIKADVSGYSPVAFESVAITPGETSQAVISRLARKQGYIVYSDSDGAVNLARAGSSYYEGGLVDGENTLSFTKKENMSGRFRDYKLVGQGDFGAGSHDNSSNVAASALDSGVRDGRCLIVVGDSAMDEKDAEERIRWEASRRAGDSLSVAVTVPSFLAPDGKPWEINKMIKVKSDYCGIDRDLLISGVGFSLSESGSVASLTLQPRESFLPEPEIESGNWI